MTRILAIDPGTVQSAWLVLDDGRPVSFGIAPNHDVLEILRRPHTAALHDVVVIEEVRSYGMAVGREVFETVKWTGRYWQAAGIVAWLGRKDVLLHLCNSPRGSDATIRAALVDRYGGKEAAIGRKAAKGPLYGIKADVWSALAVACTHHDQLERTR